MFLILVFGLAALLAPRPAVAQLLAPASQDETASPDEAQALERLYLPWLAGPSPRETMTVDHLTLGEGGSNAKGQNCDCHQQHAQNVCSSHTSHSFHC